MRTSLRPPSERGGFFRRPSTGYQGPVLEGQVLAPGKAAETRIPRTDGRERFNKSGGPSAGWQFGNLEDRIARSLGFEGKHDGAYQMAKRLARKAKINKGALNFVIEEAAEALRRMAEEGKTEPAPAPQVTGYTPCDYSSLGGYSPAGPIVGYQSLPAAACTFVTGTNASPTVPTAGPIVAILAPTTSQNFPASQFNQYNGYFPLADNLALRGMTLNAQSPAVTYRPSAMNAVDPLTTPILKTAIGVPLARPTGARALGQATRESSASSYGTAAKVATVPQVSVANLAITATKTGSAVQMHSVLRRPVKTGTKERKSYVRLPGVVAAAMNAVTETEDFVDAFWDALPDRVKRREMAQRHGKKPKFTDKAWQVWRYWHEVDLSAAMVNLVKNEVEDQIIGRMARGANKNIGRYSRRPVGRTFGPAL